MAEINDDELKLLQHKAEQYDSIMAEGGDFHRVQAGWDKEIQARKDAAVSHTSAVAKLTEDHAKALADLTASLKAEKDKHAADLKAEKDKNAADLKAVQTRADAQTALQKLEQDEAWRKMQVDAQRAALQAKIG